MKKVYLVCSGSYSDYSVEPVVFLKKKDAQALAAKLYDGDIIEAQIWDTLPTEIINYRRAYDPRFPGDIYSLGNYTCWPWNDNGISTKKRPVVNPYGHGGFIVTGTNEDQVNKVFQDRMAILKAKQEGIAD